MAFYADLHIHSKYSRATSRNCDLENLAWWAQRKGIKVVGTGDFTHPAWWQEINDKLVAAEPGLFRLRPDIERQVNESLPATCQGSMRFMLEVEISTIYKKGDKTRKVHHLIYAPDLETAGRFRDALGRIGNIASDGRPILGLDSRHLLEITLESGPGAYLVPAHIWTPWFAAMGSKSGFDSIDDCYGDLAEHIFAVETGLSSDPPMNWRVSSLDRFTLVSNSDAHSPPMLGREACVFETDLDYFAMRHALESGEKYGGTVEFFPEEGKYHLDGHRACGVCLEPEETRHHKGDCPACGKPVTVGVMHRIQTLADHPEGRRPEAASPFSSLVPLPEILSEIERVGPKSKTVQRRVSDIVNRLGPELDILSSLPIEEVAKSGDPLFSEAISRLRRGEVRRQSGYDGEYGVIRLFEPHEVNPQLRIAPLFPGMEGPGELSREEKAKQKALKKQAAASATRTTTLPTPQLVLDDPEPATSHPRSPLLAALDLYQRQAAGILEGPLLIVAGPGTGKTRTLTHRIAYLLESGTTKAEHCLALTFTRRAAEEMRERLADLLPGHHQQLQVTTFHGLGLDILRSQHVNVGLRQDFRVLDNDERVQLAADAFATENRKARRLLAEIQPLRRHLALSSLGADQADGDASPATTDDPEARRLLAIYEAALVDAAAVDFEALLLWPLKLLAEDETVRLAYQERYRFLSIDEYQDIDTTQYHLARLLAGERGNLCVIGDPDQSIYRFRGADVSFFLRFESDFPRAQRVQLERNYRSSAVIVEAALQAISPDSLVRDRRLRAVTPQQTVPIVVHAANSGAAEAEHVAHNIERLLGGTSYFSVDSGRVTQDDAMGSLSFDDFAVLYRTNAQSLSIMEALERSGIPYQRRSHDRLLDQPGVPELLAVLRQLGDGPLALEQTALFPEEAKLVTGDALRHRLDLALKQLLSDEEEDEPRNILLQRAYRLLGTATNDHEGDLASFLDRIALGHEVDTWDPRAERVSLLTLHAAKGLEFPVVFLVGLSDGTLPFSFGGQPPSEDELAEERRLFFVGLTRARSRLYLSWPRRRSVQGQRISCKPSPFLKAIEDRLLEHRRDEKKKDDGGPQPEQLSLL